MHEISHKSVKCPKKVFYTLSPFAFTTMAQCISANYLDTFWYLLAEPLYTTLINFCIIKVSEMFTQINIISAKGIRG